MKKSKSHTVQISIYEVMGSFLDLLIFMVILRVDFFFFFFNDTATTEIYTLSLHDALPISPLGRALVEATPVIDAAARMLRSRSEEHTSELQSRRDLVCRLLLEKKKQI